MSVKRALRTTKREASDQTEAVASALQAAVPLPPGTPTVSKNTTVRGLLARSEGASLEEICVATGWQAHSARAFLSGLRKVGFKVERTTGQRGETKAVYRCNGIASTVPTEADVPPGSASVQAKE